MQCRKMLPIQNGLEQEGKAPEHVPCLCSSMLLLLLKLIGTFYLRKNEFLKLKYQLLLW